MNDQKPVNPFIHDIKLGERPDPLAGLKKFMSDVHRVSKEHGWWQPDDHKSTLECLALVTAEVAEAMEEVRFDPPRPPIYQYPAQTGETRFGHPFIVPADSSWSTAGKPEGLSVELADVILRILDLAEHHELPLIEALLLKHAYNATRPYKHGKKL
jgi:NTP pyrophosphatase (non-canonical NTP hydrolase)